jgi:hypothetical protein
MITQRTVRSSIINILIIIFIVAVIATVVTGSGSVSAQSTGPDGPVINSAPGSSTSSSQGDGLSVVDVPIIPLSDSGDGLPPGMASGNKGIQAEDPLALDNILATFSYYRLVGPAFNPRTSLTTFAYNFNGCVYETGGTDNRFMAPLLIPENSVIKYLRLYYNDTNPSSDITAWLTRYQPGVTSEDLTSLTSAGSSGYGTTLSSEITHTVDLTSWAYTIIIAPNANAASNSFCGIRVAYYAPTFGAVALPLVGKNFP